MGSSQLESLGATGRKDLFTFDPDLVVLAIGENVPAVSSEGAKAQFRAGVMNILIY